MKIKISVKLYKKNLRQPANARELGINIVFINKHLNELNPVVAKVSMLKKDKKLEIFKR